MIACGDNLCNANECCSFFSDTCGVGDECKIVLIVVGVR